MAFRVESVQLCYKHQNLASKEQKPYDILDGEELEEWEKAKREFNAIESFGWVEQWHLAYEPHYDSDDRHASCSVCGPDESLSDGFGGFGNANVYVGIADDDATHKEAEELET